MSLILLRNNGFAIFEDLGRPGYAGLGVSPSGAADRSALIAGNRAVGNIPGAAGLEIIGTCEFQAERDLLLSLTGAPARTRGGRTLSGAGPPTIVLRAGGTIEIAPSALRTYLAVRGGFTPPPALGSASYDTLSGLGPEPLTAGDRLPIGRELPELRTTAPDVSGQYRPVIPGGLLLASVYPGPRAAWVEDIDTLFDHEYTVSERSSRVGVRLEGPRLRRRPMGELPSEGIVRGAVQLPPSGEPVIFGPDHPTTGGYPVIGVLAPAALDALAHAGAGQAVRFRRARPRS